MWPEVTGGGERRRVRFTGKQKLGKMGKTAANEESQLWDWGQVCVRKCVRKCVSGEEKDWGRGVDEQREDWSSRALLHEAGVQVNRICWVRISTNLRPVIMPWTWSKPASQVSPEITPPRAAIPTSFHHLFGRDNENERGDMVESKTVVFQAFLLWPNRMDCKQLNPPLNSTFHTT